jgi:hypothetical protein
MKSPNTRHTGQLTHPKRSLPRLVAARVSARIFVVATAAAAAWARVVSTPQTHRLPSDFPEVTGHEQTRFAFAALCRTERGDGSTNAPVIFEATYEYRTRRLTTMEGGNSRNAEVFPV